MTAFQQNGDPSLSEGIGKRMMTPGGAVAPALAPELFPCVVLENDRPEMLFLTGSARYARRVTVGAGGAGTRSSVQLVNWLADQLIVIERIDVTVPSGLAVVSLQDNRFVNVLPFGTAFRGVPVDSRRRQGNGNLSQSAGVLVTDNTLGAVAISTQFASALTLSVTTPLVLGPHGAIYISPNADNVAIDQCVVVWRERKANPSELV